MQPAGDLTAQHRLGGQVELARDRARELGDLLVVQRRHPLAHRHGQRERLRDAQRLGHLRQEVVADELAEQADAIAPTPFRGVHRAVRGGKQRVGGLRVRR